ncbi:hypothetical protein [Hymenobacter sp. UYCo722]|uniref:hypothetical protein n=1 Tax=Hymenobacter sp. UYCo722 TaxID=3156335 RepID=UPI0033925DF3
MLSPPDSSCPPELHQSLLKLSLAGLLLLRPVSGGADGTAVMDFSLGYSNPATGLLLARFPPVEAAALKAFCCRVFDTSVPVQHNVH